MEITFTVKITEEGIPQLMGLLARMWDNPNPAAQVRVETAPEGKTVTVTPEAPAAAPHQATAPAAEAQPARRAPKPLPPVTAAQVQAAAGAFMDEAPGNIAILQGIMTDLGVQAFPQLQPEQLQVFAARLREHGVAV